MPEKDYLYLHLRDLPYFRGLLRAIEARLYQDIDLPGPTLDVGCGDGHFASVAFDRPLEVGIDPWEGPIREAAARHAGDRPPAQRKVYRLLVIGDAGRSPFPDAYFASALSNSVLEHIPHVEAVLAETARVLQPGAPFAFCVPNHQFSGSLSVGRACDRIGLHALGDRYRAFFNRIARHVHCDPPEVWQPRLEAAGFSVEKWFHYYPPRAMQVSEWGHYFGLPSLLARKLTGRWVIAPTRWNLALTMRLVRGFYQRPAACNDGTMTFYLARRKGEGK
jgi:SAM-dependent methyltransferase